MGITSSGGGCDYNDCNLNPYSSREIAMKKVMLTAAVTAALLCALAAGTAGVPTVHGQSDGFAQ
jgi:hypothetical protein